MLDPQSADGHNLSPAERMVSGLGGAFLLGLGLTRRSRLATAFLLAGGTMLVERGLSGHCPIYRAFGFDGRVRPGDRHVLDEVDRAVDDSFPASDPPSWSPHTVGTPATAQ